MGKYAVCILCHNLHFLKVMFDNMPEQSEDITFVIVNDSRVKPLVKQIWDLMKGYDLPNKVYFLNDEKVNTFVKKDLKLSNSAKEFVDINTMCLNQNLPYYFMQKGANEFDKLLMLDDDVLINGNLLEIFNSKEPIYNYNGLTTGKGDNSDFMQEYLKIVNVSREIWETHSLNSGVRLYFLNNNVHKQIYVDCLKQYFESEILKNYFKFWVDNGKVSKGKTHAFFQDQFLENAFAWRINCHNSKLDKFCRILYAANLKNKHLYRNKIICHYCLPAWQKIKFIDELREAGVIDV